VGDPHRDPALAERARRALHRTGLEHRAMQSVAILSHGERKQLELAIALASEPRLILLDEPMAGLSPAETETMVGLLASLKGACAMLLVEHDMEAVFRLADRISVLVYGRVIAEGDAEAIRRHPEVRTAYLGEETA
jgi:branched-chain amino acid transport system ATP-binding protein